MGLKTVVILFIFGASIASGQYMPKVLRPTPYDMSVMPYLRSNGCPSTPELVPVICQFMEPQMGFFKPQLIAPTTYIPPLVIEKCDKTELEIKLPAKKPIVIPEAPILPPITIPKFPVPVIEPLPSPVPIVEPCEPAPIVVTSGAADVMVTGLNIPAAPLLPPLEMPALPEIVEVHGADMSGAIINDQSLMVPHPPIPAFVMPEVPPVPPMMLPCPEDELIPVPIPEFIQPLAPIPAAPELPPARLPEIPFHVEIPPQPIVPPMIIGQAVSTLVMPEFQAVPPMIVPCPEDERIAVPIPEFIQPLAPFPAAPALPPARLPEIPLHVEIAPPPIAPPMVIEHIEEPCLTGEIVHRKPVIIAQPPRIPKPMPIFPAHEPAIIADPCEPAFQPVMKVSRHPPYFVRPLPSYAPAQATRPVVFPAQGMFPYVHRI